MQTNGNPDILSALKLLTLIEISKSINDSALELDDLLNRIMDSCKTLLEVESSSLMLANYEKQALVFHIISGEGKELKKMEVPIGVGIAGIVAQTEEPLIVNNAQEDPRVYKEADKKAHFTTRNIICVPLIANGRVIGVLEAINTIDRPDFNENDDLLLMKALAEHAAIAITNNQIYDRIKTRVNELKALHEVSKLAMRHEKVEDMMRESLSIVSRALRCKHCSILLQDPANNTFKLSPIIVAENSTGEPPEPCAEYEIAQDVFLHRSEIFAENIAIDPRFQSNIPFRYTTHSFISVPLQSRNRPFGVLSVYDRLDESAFDSDNVTLLRTIANQISEIQENILHFEETKTAIRIRRDLEITRQMQEDILPKKFQKIDGVDMYACCKPANEVGGDFYDYFYTPEYPNEFIASISDISGKSIPAMLFMAISRSVLRAQIVHQATPSPAKILELANIPLLNDSSAGMFATSFIIYCDIARRKLTYSNAGHNAPLLLRKGEETFISLHTAGKPLAVSSGAKYAEAVVKIKDGDLLVMYTDGLVEANNKEHEEFGMKRIREAILSCRDLSAQEIAGTLLERVNEFAAGEPQFDDITLFIFKFNFE